MIRLPLLAPFLLPGVAAAQDLPPPDYFTGVYERVGRDAGAPAGLVNDRVRLDPDAEGTGLELRHCGRATKAPEARLAFESFGEVSNLLNGGSADPDFWCLYHNDGNNYPLLTCAAPDGRRVTLWPAPDMPCDP